ncbi:hypothetical protein B5S31_g2171 [[Candida] boidinii]|nr:hypothetical protein B5S31_g2171 [[Candida] boidinii]
MSIHPISSVLDNTDDSALGDFSNNSESDSSIIKRSKSSTNIKSKINKKTESTILSFAETKVLKPNETTTSTLALSPTMTSKTTTHVNRFKFLDHEYLNEMINIVDAKFKEFELRFVDILGDNFKETNSNEGISLDVKNIESILKEIVDRSKNNNKNLVNLNDNLTAFNSTISDRDLVKDDIINHIETSEENISKVVERLKSGNTDSDKYNNMMEKFSELSHKLTELKDIKHDLQIQKEEQEELKLTVIKHLESIQLLNKDIDLSKVEESLKKQLKLQNEITTNSFSKLLENLELLNSRLEGINSSKKEMELLVLEEKLDKFRIITTKHNDDIAETLSKISKETITENEKIMTENNEVLLKLQTESITKGIKDEFKSNIKDTNEFHKSLKEGINQSLELFEKKILNQDTNEKIEEMFSSLKETLSKESDKMKDFVTIEKLKQIITSDIISSVADKSQQTELIKLITSMSKTLTDSREMQLKEQKNIGDDQKSGIAELNTIISELSKQSEVISESHSVLLDKQNNLFEFSQGLSSDIKEGNLFVKPIGNQIKSFEDEVNEKFLKTNTTMDELLQNMSNLVVSVNKQSEGISQNERNKDAIIGSILDHKNLAKDNQKEVIEFISRLNKKLDDKKEMNDQNTVEKQNIEIKRINDLLEAEREKVAQLTNKVNIYEQKSIYVEQIEDLKKDRDELKSEIKILNNDKIKLIGELSSCSNKYINLRDSVEVLIKEKKEIVDDLVKMRIPENSEIGNDNRSLKSSSSDSTDSSNNIVNNIILENIENGSLLVKKRMSQKKKIALSSTGDGGDDEFYDDKENRSLRDTVRKTRNFTGIY